ncbi:MAG: FMN-binding protein, partial [Rhodothermia bacterium]|nr:FMN-binding protein [Rhodothermia bacterium]
YDSAGTLAGIAVEARGQGYQDVIRILYGYETGCECIVGMKVLESKETPGLGDKIEKDARFLANFDSLDVRIDGPDGELLHPIVLVKSGAKTDAWEVEAITGATVSSQAIADIIGSSAAAIAPVLKRETDAFRGQS